MKNYILLFIMLTTLIISAPVWATCSITGGACTAPSNLDPKTLEEKLVPNYLKEMKRTDAFQSSYQKPYYDMLINTEDNVTNLPPEDNYNSNYQFGVCLPGEEAGEELIE